MKNFLNMSVDDFDKSVHEIFKRQEKILNLESQTAEIHSEILKTLIQAIDSVERSLV
jgi:hypothetical protein